MSSDAAHCVTGAGSHVDAWARPYSNRNDAPPAGCFRGECSQVADAQAPCQQEERSGSFS
jgi:hypothetical protein